MKVTTNSILIFFGIIAFAIMACLPISIFAMNAIRNINPTHLRTARVMRLSPFEMARTILVPAAIPRLHEPKQQSLRRRRRRLTRGRRSFVGSSSQQDIVVREGGSYSPQIIKRLITLLLLPVVVTNSLRAPIPNQSPQ